MNQRLYVGNLPFSATQAQMQDLFSQAGTVVTADVMIDKMSGRSRGFGFVEMSNDEETQKAIEMFNGYDMDGRKLIVNIARPREERPQGDFRSNRGGGDFRRGGGRGR